MKNGTRVTFQGRTGTVEGAMPKGMIDIRFDDSPQRVERRNQALLTPASPAAQSNPRIRTNPRAPRRERGARKNTGTITVSIDNVPIEFQLADLFRWRDQQLAWAQRELRAVLSKRYQPPRELARFEAIVEHLTEATPAQLARGFERDRQYQRQEAAHKRGAEEKLVYDERTGEWVEEDWTRIKDPELREKRKQEARQKIRQLHYNYLVKARETGGVLAPLSADETQEFQWLTQVVHGDWKTVYATRLKAQEREVERDRALGQPGYTEAEGYQPGEGVDRILLTELRKARELDKTLLISGKSDEEIKALAGQGLLSPGEARVILAARIRVEAPNRTPVERPEKAKTAEEKERTRREISSALQRSTTFRPKTQRELDATISTRIAPNHAGFFTRPDPPRLSQDHHVYCGNPIDGTAYYLVVDNSKKWVAPFITWQTVEELAEKKGALPPNETIGPFPVTRTYQSAATRVLAEIGLGAKYEAGSLREILDAEIIPRIVAWGFKGADQLQQVSQALNTRRDELDSVRRELLGGHLPTTSRKTGQTILALEPRLRALETEVETLSAQQARFSKGVAELIEFYRNRVTVRVQFSNDLSKKYRIVKDLTVRIPLGSLVEIEIPTRERLSRLAQAFKVYQDKIEHKPGVSIFPVETRYRKYIRERKGKHISTRQSTPRAEEIGKQPKVSGVAQEPDPAVDYAEIGPKGVITYYRESQWKAPGAELLNEFRPFKYETLFATRTGTLAEVVAEGLGSTQALAEELIRSGAVATPLAQGQSLINLDPQAEVDGPSFDPVKQKDIPGTRVTVWLKDKASNPFFSWVPSVVPFRPESPLSKMGMEDPEKGEYAVCLSAEEKQAQRDLQIFKRCIQQLNGAFGAVRSLFQRLALEPGGLKPDRVDPNPPERRSPDGSYEKVPRPWFYGDVRRVLTKLASAYAALYRWYNGFMVEAQAGEPSTELLSSILSRAAGQARFSLADLGAAWRQFTTGTDIGTGLVGQGGEVVEILDGKAYSLFLKDYRDKLVVQRSAELSMDGWQPEKGPRTLSLVGPALLWLEGKTAGGHPADDLLAFVWNSLDAESQGRLLKARSEAIQGDGVRGLLQDLKISERSPTEAAEFVLNAAATYAQGGARTRLAHPDRNSPDLWERKGIGFSDPLRSGKAFELDSIPAIFKPILARQLDNNWATGLVLDDVYPALWRGQHREDAAAATGELLLLATSYYQLGGYTYAGPLDPMHPCHVPSAECPQNHLFDRLIRALGKEEAALMGGSINLSQTGNYTTYMTYNPVLFELTRLFWPSKASYPGFHSLFQQAQLLKDIDAVGRYGVAATNTQKAAVSSTSPDEVSVKLRALVAPAAGREKSNRKNLTLILRGPPRKKGQEVDTFEGPEDYEVLDRRGDVVGTITVGQDPLGQPIGHFSTFALLWPLGMPMEDVKGQMVQFVSDPLAYLDDLKKRRVDPVIARLVHMRGAGLSRPPSLLAGDLKGILQDVRSGKRTLDPADLETGQGIPEARALLRGALADAVSKSGLDVGTEDSIRQRLQRGGVDPELIETYLSDRRKHEAEVLTDFQSSPGNVLRRTGPRWEAQELIKPGEPAEWWVGGTFKAPRVYDAATVRLLAEAQSAPRRPPTTLPPIFDDRYYAKGSQEQAARWHGQQAIYGGSALSQAEKEQKELAAMIGSIDEALSVLDRKIAASSPKKTDSPAKKNGRRPRKTR